MRHLVILLSVILVLAPTAKAEPKDVPERPSLSYEKIRHIITQDLLAEGYTEEQIRAELNRSFPWFCTGLLQSDPQEQRYIFEAILKKSGAVEGWDAESRQQVTADFGRNVLNSCSQQPPPGDFNIGVFIGHMLEILVAPSAPDEN